MELSEAIAALQLFGGTDLTRTLAHIEASLKGTKAETCADKLADYGANADTLSAAGQIKRLASQINIVIHALGILLCLPHILEPGEEIDCVSLGAGNTGRRFDLETKQRIAEFKFTRWRGGPEAIRQNAVFMDFYRMAEYDTPKKRFLYVVDATQPNKFFKGRRALSSVLSHEVSLWRQCTERYGDRYRTVADYYHENKDRVVIQDVSSWIPELLGPDD